MTTRSVCVVTDANVLINLMHVSRLWLLGRRDGGTADECPCCATCPSVAPA